MTVAEIKLLPDEFDFKSNINTFGIKYHAVKEKHGYKVTCDANSCEWDFTREEIHRNLLNGNYKIIQ